MKFSTDAKTLNFSTLLAGTSSDYGYALAVDNDDYATVTGFTHSPQLAGSNANQGASDIFVVRLQPEGDAVAFSVLLGDSGYDVGYGLDVDGAGNIYVTGYTSSAEDFPVTNNAAQSAIAGSYDAFVLQLSAEDGQVQYGSYLGGSSWDLGYGIAVSDAGHMYLSGYTYSGNDFPQKNNPYSYGGGTDAYFTLISAAVTKYYRANGQLVAFRRESGYGEAYGLRYVFDDHLGSTSLVINGGGEVLWVDYFKPFGGYHYTWSKWADGLTPTNRQTDYRFTGQRQESDIKLYDYISRWYDYRRGRFVQADTIVPEPGNPQSLNRYSYVGNNPIRYSDPSGHAPQHPGDPDPNNAACSTQWCWENRWYRARGYGWNGSGWGNTADPVFYDQGALTEMAADAGISFVGSWQFNRQMKAVGSGIALFGRNLAQGLRQLKALLGGGARLKHGSCMGSSCALPVGTQTVRFSQETLGSPSQWIAQTTVHELAHVIDWHSRIQTGSVKTGIQGQISVPVFGRFSDAWDETPLTGYASGDGYRPYPRRWEVWADAVATWVFGSKTDGLTVKYNDQFVQDQVKRIGKLLNGRY